MTGVQTCALPISESGNLLSNGLALLTALGDGVRTDLDQALLPTLADGAGTLDATHIVSAQMRAGDGILRYRRKGEFSPYGSVVFFDPAAMSMLGARLFPTPGSQPYGWPMKAGDPPFTAMSAGSSGAPTDTPSGAPSTSPSMSRSPSLTVQPTVSASGAPSPTAPAPATAAPPTRPYPPLASCNANVPAPVYTPEPDPTEVPPPSESPSPPPSSSPGVTETPSATSSPTIAP